MAEELHIERFALRMPGVSEQEGRQLSDLVHRQLEEANVDHLRLRDIGALNLSVEAEPGMSPSRLANLIVEEVLGALK